MEIEVQMINFVQTEGQEQDAQEKIKKLQKSKNLDYPEKIDFSFLINCCDQITRKKKSAGKFSPSCHIQGLWLLLLT